MIEKKKEKKKKKRRKKKEENLLSRQLFVGSVRLPETIINFFYCFRPNIKQKLQQKVFS